MTWLGVKISDATTVGYLTYFRGNLAISEAAGEAGGRQVCKESRRRAHTIWNRYSGARSVLQTRGTQIRTPMTAPFLNALKARIGIAAKPGADNDEILAKLGYTPAQIEDFEAKKIIR